MSFNCCGPTFGVEPNTLLMSTAYTSLLSELKSTVRTARVHAIQLVNRSLILMYWELGRQIVASQEAHGWGKETVEQLSQDLKAAFPSTKGLSTRNLWRMRQFYLTYGDLEILPQAVAEIPWGHHDVLMRSKFSPEARLFYIQKTDQPTKKQNKKKKKEKIKAKKKKKKKKKKEKIFLKKNIKKKIF